MGKVERLQIGNTDVFLEDLGNSKGKITISDTYGHNYSYFWGSMGGTLKEFLCSIDDGYFASKLFGSRSELEIDVPRTFATLRKFIATELDLPWYKHLEFQKDMREILREFQSDCEDKSADYFVAMFKHGFVERLRFFCINDDFDRKEIEKNFRNISEWWNFIEEKHTKEFLWLIDLHKKLKKQISVKQLT